jgi:hypothetical protein
MAEHTDCDSAAMLEKIVSGGQTGVDRAALDAAIGAGLACGGWCPAGRRAEDGVIPDCYRLKETPSGKYRQRTEWNVRDSDGTLVLVRGIPQGGTRYAVYCALRLGRQFCLVSLDGSEDPGRVAAWIDSRMIAVLNVAGPRASSDRHIYADARSFLDQVIYYGRKRTPAGS